MPRRSKTRRKARHVQRAHRPADPYRDQWLDLPAFERLERSWRLRKLIPDPQAVHDAKTLPEL